MHPEHSRKVIIMSMSGLLIGSLLFIFGASLKASILPLIANYIIAVLLTISSFLAVYNNHKKEPYSIYKYIMILSVVIILMITISFISIIL